MQQIITVIAMLQFIEMGVTKLKAEPVICIPMDIQDTF